MTLVDANLLLYAYNTDVHEHATARRWLERRLSSPEPLAFAWQTIASFLRLVTHRAVFPRPWSPAEAVEVVASWLARPMVVLLEPGPRHWEIVRRLVVEGNARGALVPDALLAALALEHGAELATHDRDFARFPGLRIHDPLSSAPPK